MLAVSPVLDQVRASAAAVWTAGVVGAQAAVVQRYTVKLVSPATFVQETLTWVEEATVQVAVGAGGGGAV